MKGKPHSFLRHSEPVCQRFLSIVMSISLNTLKLHNERVDELFKKVEDNFKWNPVHPKEDISSIMYRAGQASVVEYIRNLLEEEN
tara:strand:- start:273 stop:527 length:255 start_codon:yes stop_codon:yes gene_type:complete